MALSGAMDPVRGEARLVVLFDAECGFCRWAVAHLARWDRGSRGRDLLEPRPLQAAAADPRLAPSIAGLDLAEALTVVDPVAGATARGGDAVLAIALRLPGGGVLRPWLGVPPFRAAVRALYGFVARSRSTLAALGMTVEPGREGGA